MTKVTKLNRVDLDFLLQNVTIGVDYTQLTNPLDPRGLRETAGSNNNLVGHEAFDGDPNTNAPGPNAGWGAADEPFLRISQHVERTGIDTNGNITTYTPDGANVQDVSPRVISNLVSNSWTSGSQGASSVTNLITNFDFEADSLVVGQPGVTPDPLLGNSTNAAPAGWAVTGGEGGAYAPTSAVSDPAGHSGSNVAWLRFGAELSQTTNETLVEGKNYQLSLKVGERGDPIYDNWPGGEVRLVAVDGSNNETTIASIALPTPPDGGWSDVTLDTGPIAAALAGQTLRIEIAHTAPGDYRQILVDDVVLGSANQYANPAADAQIASGAGVVETDANGNATAFIGNVGPLGAASYNNQFVFFGQFFDHGLDFIKKDGSGGFIEIPLTPGDPHYDPTPGARNVMLINRANLANPVEAAAGTEPPVYLNNTGLLIDQSQTYGSHPSVNAILREYDENGVPTGRVVTGNTAPAGTWDVNNPPPINPAGASVATWADIKLNALRIGLVLQDSDVLNMREIETDAKGQIVRDVNGNAQFTGNLTDQPLLIDINPAANPDFHFDIDPATGMEKVYAGGLDYDSALLDAHYIAGDGRANENFFLTAQHHVWHDEHNFQVQNLKSSILSQAITDNDLQRINDWLDSASQLTDLTQFVGLDLTDQAAVDAAANTLSWNGEFIFQAARSITETEYNHVAIDEYVGRLVADLPEFVSFSTDINTAVSLEFAQSIFRLGHSMLTENLELRDADGNVTSVPLFDAFVNPEGFATNGPSALLEGAIKQLANEVDEFVTPALQQTLLGQPLDLAAINIARGRDIGLPTWNEFRQQVFDGLAQTPSNSQNSGALAPYTSWTDVGGHLRNPETLVNLIAAYARGGDETGLTGDALAIVQLGNAIKAARDVGDLAGARAAAATAMASTAFMEGAPTYDQSTGTWALSGGDQGFWDIDLWLGGLAERPLIDGMLGTTFSFVFLDFAQRMQDGDRFYYLYRMPPGTSIGQQIISTKFSDIIARNTTTNDLNGDAFAYADRFFSPDATKFDSGASHFVSNNESANGGVDGYYFSAHTAPLDEADPTGDRAAAGHIVISGGDGDDHLIAGDGDDTVHGHDGDDYIQGGQGNDHLFGGAGNDYIIDDENDDFIRGGTGDDTIFAGKGALDTVFGEEGNDEIHGGDGIDELFGGVGDDAIFGDGDTDVIVGGLGNDFANGGDSVDEIWTNDGNDILVGGVGDDHLNGGGGSDLLFGGLGAAANDGDRLIGDANPAGSFNQILPEGGFEGPPGFDIASYEFVGVSVTADLQTSNQNGTGTLLDTYAFVDGLVGSQFDDNLTGAGADTITNNGVDNLLVGGAGNDVLQGLGGNDDIVGDWVVVNNSLQVHSNQDKSAAIVDSHGLNRIDTGDFANAPAGSDPEAWLGHVLGDNGAEGTADVAVFRGDIDNYTISDLGNGWVEVRDDRDVATTPDHDGTDRVRGIETLRFADGDFSIGNVVNRAPVVNGPVVLPGLLVNTSIVITLAQLLQGITDPDGDQLTILNLTASSGDLVDNGNGSWTYTPVLNDVSDVTFNFDVSDGSAAPVPATATMDLLPAATNNVINGTDNGETILGTPANDTIDAKGGNDKVMADAGDDLVMGGAGNDELHGEDGADLIFGDVGNDRIFGGAGNDIIFGDDGNDELFGQDGNDLINGGAGNDTISGGAGNDILTGGADADMVLAGTGNDIVTATIGDGSDIYNGEAGTDTYDLSGTSAAANVDLAAGTATSAETGSDVLTSFENVRGSAGGDTIHFSDATNVVGGGGGADTFTFGTIAEAGNGATRDVITDFTQGVDTIDLSAIDANLVEDDDQAFELLNPGEPITEGGRLKYVFENGNTIIEGNVDANPDIDFQIELTGQHNLTSGDFNL